MKIKALLFFETLVTIYQSTRHHVSEDMQINLLGSKELRAGKACRRDRVGVVCGGRRKDDDDDDYDSGDYVDYDDKTYSTPKIPSDMFPEQVFVINMEEDNRAGTNSSSWREILWLKLQGRGRFYFDRQVRRFGRTTFKFRTEKSHFFQNRENFLPIIYMATSQFLNLNSLYYSVVPF